MNSVIMSLQNELASYWKWAGTSPELYSKYEWKSSYEEWEYPKWDSLMDSIMKAINLMSIGNYSSELAQLILEVMALDNEDEIVLEACETQITIDNLELLICEGVKFYQPEARWQIAELIGRKGYIEWCKYLDCIINDENNYVQRRALLSLSKIDKQCAEKAAFDRLLHKDDYIRLVSLRILHETRSDRLDKAVELLKNDSFRYIQDEIKEIQMI